MFLRRYCNIHNVESEEINYGIIYNAVIVFIVRSTTVIVSRQQQQDFPLKVCNKNKSGKLT